MYSATRLSNPWFSQLHDVSSAAFPLSSYIPSFYSCSLSLSLSLIMLSLLSPLLSHSISPWLCHPPTPTPSCPSFLAMPWQARLPSPCYHPCLAAWQQPPSRLATRWLPPSEVSMTGTRKGNMGVQGRIMCTVWFRCKSRWRDAHGQMVAGDCLLVVRCLVVGWLVFAVSLGWEGGVAQPAPRKPLPESAPQPLHL